MTDYQQWLSSLGNAIRATREELNLTQRAAATQIGIAYSQYRGYEAGRLPVSTRTLHQICDGFGISIKELIDKT